MYVIYPSFCFIYLLEDDMFFFVMLYYHVSFFTFLSVCHIQEINIFQAWGGVTIWKSRNYNILLIYTVSNRFIF